MSDHLRAGVIGWPIEHSRSPIIHGYWLEKHEIAGDYTRIPVSLEEVESFFGTFLDQGLAGVNVTIPHKEAAFRCMDRTDTVAESLQAVNTVWIEDEKLVGSNTDAYGFLANLDQEAPGWHANQGNAVIIGAGGAARSIIFALMERGFRDFVVANRTVQRAYDLKQHFDCHIQPIALADLPANLGNANILVNTTSLGMSGQPDLDLPLDQLPEHALVTDIVYVPLVTGLLRNARDRGNPIVDGLGMLLHQAVPGFERWFGVRPVVSDELRRRVLADLDEAT